LVLGGLWGVLGFFGEFWWGFFVVGGGGVCEKKERDHRKKKIPDGRRAALKGNRLYRKEGPPLGKREQWPSQGKKKKKCARQQGAC